MRRGTEQPSMSNAFCAVIAFQVSQLVKDPFAEDELTTIRISHFNFPISPYILSAMANGLPGISVRVFATNVPLNCSKSMYRRER